MRSRHKSQAIIVVECLRYVLPKSIASTTWGNAPPASVVRVTPEKIAHGTLMRDFLNTIQRADVVQSVDRRAKAAVKAEDLVVNEGGQGQEIEKVGEVLPYVCVAVFSQALVVEAVHLCDLTRFVIAAKDSDAGRVADLERNEEGHSLNRVVATVDIVAYTIRQIQVSASDLPMNK